MGIFETGTGLEAAQAVSTGPVNPQEPPGQFRRGVKSCVDALCEAGKIGVERAYDDARVFRLGGGEANEMAAVKCQDRAVFRRCFSEHLGIGRGDAAASWVASTS
jgi:hypothetical protein